MYNLLLYKQYFESISTITSTCVRLFGLLYKNACSTTSTWSPKKLHVYKDMLDMVMRS